MIRLMQKILNIFFRPTLGSSRTVDFDGTFYDVPNITNVAQFEDVIVDEAAGIGVGKCCYLTGSSSGIPTIALASISNPDHVPAYGVSIQAKNDGETIRIIKRGTITFDTTIMAKTPEQGDVLYLGESGALESEPTGGINGNLQIARVLIEGSNGLITIELNSFALSAELDGVIRSIIQNTSDGINAGTAVTAKNDVGDYASIGMTGSNNQFGARMAVLFNSGANLLRFLVNGNFGFGWRTDTGAGQSDKMELSADGKLTGRGTVKFDGDEKEDGGLWTNLSDEELKIQFGEVEYSISTSAYERATLSLTVDQSIGAGAFTPVAWDQEDIDVGDIHDNAVNPSRITVSKPGDYLLIADIQFDASAAGNRGVRFAKNGVVLAQTEIVRSAVGGTDTFLDKASFVRLAADDFIEVEVFQSSGGGLDILADGCSFTLVRLYDTA